MGESKEKVSIPKPSPIRDAGNVAFFDGAARGKLMIQHCETCGKYTLCCARYCPHCYAPLVWKPAVGRGKIHTWTVNYQKSHPAFVNDIPYPIVKVQLDEGPMIIGGVVDIKTEELRIGLPVSVRFVNNGNGESFPAFGPA